MPYKDKETQKEYIKKWREKNKESFNKKQIIYQCYCRDKKYIK